MPSLRHRLRRVSRPWTHLHSGVIAGLVAALLGAGINGWGWLPTGWAVVSQVERSGNGLPVARPFSGRVLFVSPHPDDETLAAGGLLQDVQARGGQVFVVFLTSGDGFPWDVRTQTVSPTLKTSDYLRLGRMRMQEARDATAKLGIPGGHVFFLGLPDRGLSALNDQNYLVPYKNRYTGVSRVPYSGTLQPGALYTGKNFESMLSGVFDKTRPDVVLAPSALDGHPDHRAASVLTTRLATQRQERLYYYLVHGGLEWPLPKGYHPTLPLSPPRPQQQGIEWQRYKLSPDQEQRKVEAIRAYKTQLRLLSRFMWAFARDNELLLPAPEHER